MAIPSRVVERPGPEHAHDPLAVGVEDGRAAAPVGRAGHEVQVDSLVAQHVALETRSTNSAGAADRDERVAGSQHEIAAGHGDGRRKHLAERRRPMRHDGRVGLLVARDDLPGQRTRLVAVPPELALHLPAVAHHVGGGEHVDAALAHFEHAAGAPAALRLGDPAGGVDAIGDRGVGGLVEANIARQSRATSE